MVLKYSDKNSNGFSLVESLIALVIVSLTIGSIFFALQSNIFLSQKIRDQISWQFITSNAYSELVLNNKLLDKKTLRGENLINQKKYRWYVETIPTAIENLHTFEFFTIDQNDKKKKVKTEYYVYFQTQ
jgi:prepilin-type N-terminal cleavage/methylation domain-containing protein